MEVNKLPNIDGAIKRVRTNQKANERNSAKISEMRTARKKFEQAAEAGDANAADLYKDVVKLIDQAASKGLIHKNKADRDKSRLHAKLAK